MNVRKFIASDARLALKKVKETLGDDAVILSNRTIDGQVEIMAVAGRDMAMIVTPPARETRPDPVATYPEDRVTLSRPAASAPQREPLAPRSAEVRRPEAPAARPTQTQAAQVQAKRPMLAPGLSTAVSASSESNSDVMDELRALRKIVEQHLAGYAWGEFSRQNPARSELLRQLLDVGFSPRLADHWLGQIRPEQTPGEAIGYVKAAVERGLATLGPEDDVIERGGVFALVGPTGVGKTTTTAKLAARCVLRHGREKVALITTDGYRIGAHEQLRIYGRILGVPVHAVRDATGLRETLAELAGKHLVLIDTMGMSQRDRNVVEQTRMFDGCQVERLLLLPATARGDTLDDVIASYGGASLSGCVLTKIDEAVSLAPALDAVIRHRLAVAFVCNGQRVPEDLHLPNRAYLVHRAFKEAGEQSPHRSRGVEPAVMMAAAGYFPAQARA
jgi:flagellar biosynthesis protein FlhF